MNEEVNRYTSVCRRHSGRRRTMRIFAALLTVLPVAAFSGPAQSGSSISVVDYGIYKLSVVHRAEAQRAIGSERNVVSNIRIFRRTRTVFAQLGRSFGYRFRIADPTLLGRQLTLRTAFPPLEDPQTGRSGTSQSRPFMPLSSGVYYDGYRFDFMWELAEGLWRFQLLDGEKLLHEEVLRVVVPLN